MNRREMLGLGMGVAVLVLAGQRPARADLEPDAMWSIYSRYRLLVVGQRDDEVALALAAAVADVLAASMPASRARMARAEDTWRVGVLIATNQLDLAIMTAQDAEALLLSAPPFEDVHEVALRLLVSFGSHVLVCRDDLAANHAYLFAQNLAEHDDELPMPVGRPAGVVPAHPGSHAYFAGESVTDVKTVDAPIPLTAPIAAREFP
jgi:hypothetical protein